MSDENRPIHPTKLDFKKTAHLLSHEVRWRLLRELGQGEALPPSELARRVGMTPNATRRHLVLLRQGGLVMTGYAGLYSLTPDYRPAPGATTIDFGHCLIRLDTSMS